MSEKDERYEYCWEGCYDEEIDYIVKTEIIIVDGKKVVHCPVLLEVLDDTVATASDGAGLIGLVGSRGIGLVEVHAIIVMAGDEQCSAERAHSAVLGE